jgi:hypothetical protein
MMAPKYSGATRDMTPTPDFALTTSFARAFGVLPRVFKQWAARGLKLRDGRLIRLPAVRRGHHLYTSRQDIENFLSEARRVGLRNGSKPAATWQPSAAESAPAPIQAA